MPVNAPPMAELPKVASLRESPVMKKTQEVRTQARKEENEEYANKVAHRRKTFTQANEMLDQATKQFEMDSGLDAKKQAIENQRRLILERQAVDPKDPGLANLQIVLDQQVAEYQSDFKMVESISLAAAQDAEPGKGATKEGTQNKAAALIAWRQNLIGKYNGAGNDLKREAIGREIVRVNGVAMQLDEMLRVDTRLVRGRIKRKVGQLIKGCVGGLIEDIGGAPHGAFTGKPFEADQLHTIDTNFIKKDWFARKRMKVPEQAPVTSITAQVLEIAADPSRKMEMQNMVNGLLEGERRRIYTVEKQNAGEAGLVKDQAVPEKTDKQVFDKARTEWADFVAQNGMSSINTLQTNGYDLDTYATDKDLVDAIHAKDAAFDNDPKTPKGVENYKQVKATLEAYSLVKNGLDTPDKIKAALLAKIPEIPPEAQDKVVQEVTSQPNAVAKATRLLSMMPLLLMMLNTKES